jgi:sulfur-carrier protein
VVVVRLPSLVAEQAGGQREFEVEGSTLGEALRALPIADLLLDERGELRRLVNVYLDGEDARRAHGLETPLAGVHEVRVIAAVAGGR